MEQKNMENIDIEKHKELFAYEMTEVILKLKGEFAVVSGKDTQYWKDRVEEKSLKIAPVVLPETGLEQVQLPVPQVPAVSAIALPEVSNTYPQVTMPEIGRFCTPKPVQLKLEPIQVAVPRVIVPDTRISEPELEQPLGSSVPQVRSFHGIDAVELPKVGIQVDVPSIPASFTYHTPEISPVALTGGVFESDRIGVYTPPAPATLLTEVNIPNVTLPGAYVPPIPAAVQVKVSIPGTKTPGDYVSPTQPAFEADIPVPNTNIPAAYQPPAPGAAQVQVSVPEVKKPPVAHLPQWDGLNVHITYPEIPDNAALFRPEAVVQKVHLPMFPKLSEPIPTFYYSGESVPEIAGITPPALPDTDLSGVLKELWAVPDRRTVSTDKVRACAVDVLALLSEAGRILESAKVRLTAVTDDLALDEFFRQAMQIDTSFISAEEFFRGFQFEA